MKRRLKRRGDEDKYRPGELVHMNQSTDDVTLSLPVARDHVVTYAYEKRLEKETSVKNVTRGTFYTTIDGE